MKIGDKFRVGGKLGCIMTVSEIRKNEVILISDDGKGICYWKPGDCTLIPYKDYEQLTLF